MARRPIRAGNLQVLSFLQRPSAMPASQGKLTPTFLAALKTWKPQVISFLQLPPEIRNHIYALVLGFKGSEIALSHLGKWRSGDPPSLALMHTCTQMQQELGPLCISSLTVQMDTWRRTEIVVERRLRTLSWMKKVGPDVSAHISTLRVRFWDKVHFMFTIKVIEPRIVEVTSESCPRSDIPIREEIEAAMNTELSRRLEENSTGYLGVAEMMIIRDIIREHSPKNRNFLLGYHNWDPEVVEY